WVRDHDAFLLTNHGALTVGQDPFDAYYRLETLEQYCRILLLARQTGDWNTLDHGHMEELLRLKEKLGVTDPRRGGETWAFGARPAGEPRPLPAEPFHPHPGPLMDAPKFGKVKAPAVEKQGPENSETIRSVVEEVVSRLLS